MLFLQYTTQIPGFFNPSLAGGCMLDIGIYPIYFAFLVLGSKFNDLRASGIIGPTGVDEAMAISIAYPSAMATLYASFKHRGLNNAFIFGETGYIQLPLFWKAEGTKLYSESGELWDEFHDQRKCHGFAYQIDHVMECINNGLIESPVVPLGLSYNVQLTMQEAINQLGL
ncbi:MAG: hypothetical protein IPN29_12210 [Saprospiraceae bacterium]|nr:hypothetical protein [Saprospiraceae bacterium]